MPGQYFFDLCKKILELPGKDSSLIWVVELPLDGVRLPRASLAICKDCTVESEKTRVNNWFSDLLEHLDLCHIFTGNKIEGELFRVLCVEGENLFILNASNAAFLILGVRYNIRCLVGACQRSDPHNDLYFVS
jgi:hypothetical protein